ncbi:MAG: magnesium/cobalt transporter CorA [Paludibacter sp.]|nr:magnesium/cobalt transporter CorA [Paludibacter sp.]
MRKQQIKHFVKPKVSRKKKEDIGLSPYAVVFRGEKRMEKTLINAMDFDLEEVREFEVTTPEQLHDLHVRTSLSWIFVNGIHDTSRLGEVAREFEIPNNILSDILNPSLRSKIEVFDKGVFVTIKLLQYQEKTDQVTIENLSLIICENTLISFREEAGPVFEPIRERIRKYNNKIRTSGSDYLAFTLLDVVVDNYIYILGALGEKIETLDDKMTTNPHKQLLDEINVFKREINFLRKSILPAKEMILSLAKLDVEFLHDINRLHFRELQYNINEATELSDSYREILFDQISIYHTIVSTRLNDIMRTLTIFSVIFIPLTFIVGVYGTNFDILPELHWKNGYYIMWGVMLVIALAMLIYFSRKKWF